MPFVKNNQKSLKYERKLRDFSRNCLKNETTNKILHMSGPGGQRSLAAVGRGAKICTFGKKLVNFEKLNNQQKIPYSRFVRAKRLAALHREPLT